MLPGSSEIQYFIEVAHCQNLSRASEKLGITQPTLSLSMKKLETNLGVILFTRSKSGVKLTKYGKKFLVSSRNLLDQWQKMQYEATREETDIRGRYTLGLHPSVALYTLSNFLPKFLENYKDVELTLNHGLSRIMTEEVISYKSDFGIVVNPVHHPDLVITPLCLDEVKLWQIPGNKNTDVLICDDSLSQSLDIMRKLKKNHQKKFKRVISSNNLEVVQDLVRSGAGVGILPARVALKDKSHKLKTLSKELPIFTDKICLIYRMDSQKTATFKLIIEEIKSIFN